MSSTGNKENTGYIFDVAQTSATVGTIEYSIKNPTKFISPLLDTDGSVQNPSSASQCVAGTDGDWYFPNPNHADNLWGGSSFTSALQYVADGWFLQAICGCRSPRKELIPGQMIIRV